MGNQNSAPKASSGAKAAPASRAWKAVSYAWSNYAFIFIFAAIFIIFLLCSGGVTWNGVMNILRHSGVVGIVALDRKSVV